MAVTTAAPDQLAVLVNDSHPNLVLSTVTAQQLLDALRALDVSAGGRWKCSATIWQRFSRPWTSADEPGGAQLVGSIHVMYGVPTSYDVTLHRATLTPHGYAAGWTPSLIVADALAAARLMVSDCGTVILPTTPTC